jgi:hypothetical protein
VNSGPLFHVDGSAPPVEEKWVLVYGSNAHGLHYGGAALFTKERFGAEMGAATGRVGNSYGIATCERPGTPGSYSLQQVADQVSALVRHVDLWRGDKFWMTRVGCQRAGFADSEIAPLFASLSAFGDRVSFPENWREWVTKRV